MLDVLAPAGRTVPLSILPRNAVRTHVIAKMNREAVGAKAMCAKLRLACQHADFHVLTEMAVLIVSLGLVGALGWNTCSRHPTCRLRMNSFHLGMRPLPKVGQLPLLTSRARSGNRFEMVCFQSLIRTTAMFGRMWKRFIVRNLARSPLLISFHRALMLVDIQIERRATNSKGFHHACG